MPSWGHLGRHFLMMAIDERVINLFIHNCYAFPDFVNDSPKLLYRFY